MPEPPFDSDPSNARHDHDAHGDRGYDAPQAPQQVVAPSRVIYCKNCGGQLNGLSIGVPCPNCGVPVGSAAGGLRTSGLAVTSMVLGICSIPTCMCYGIFSIIIGAVGLFLGSLAKKELAKGGYNDSSNGMAKAGIICSWIGIGLGVTYILFLVGIILFAQLSQ